MSTILLAVREFGLALGALFPIINPLGSALLFFGLVGLEPPQVYRALSRKIAATTIAFLLIVEFAGSAVLAFLNISLPVVQLTGGLVLAAIGWNVLNAKDAEATTAEKDVPAGTGQVGSLAAKVFYPFTFPLTAGPGTIVVMLTLSAHASRSPLPTRVAAHAGIVAAVFVVSFTVYLSYAYAATLAQKIAPQTAHGILRMIAFVLLCIGVQIAVNGVMALVSAAHAVA